MIIFLVLYILQMAKGSLIFREITSGNCSDYPNWEIVSESQECDRIQSHIHLYKHSKTRLGLNRQLSVPPCNYEYNQFNLHRWRTKKLHWNIPKIQTLSTNTPHGCFNFGHRDGRYMFYNKMASTTPCSVAMPCICKYTPPPGSFVSDFIERLCHERRNGVMLHTVKEMDFNWPKLYDDTRTRQIDATCENDLNTCQKHSLFAERRFQETDMTDVWHSGNHEYIYDNLDNPIPLFHCTKGSVVTFDDFATQCRKCPAGKYHDGDFTQNNACVDCSSGKYNDQLGSTSCQTCEGEIKANGTLCTPCLSSNKIWNGTACQSCPSGHKTHGNACVRDVEYCDIGQIYDSGTCTSLPTQNVLTQSIDRFLNRAQSIPGGNDNQALSRMTKQIMKELGCDTIDLGYETRLAEKISGVKSVLLPTIDVYPNYQDCLGPTRALRQDGKCRIEYETEILDSFRFETAHLLAQSSSDIYNALKLRTGISVDNADCPSAMPDCSTTRRTNCKCGTSVCKSNELTICNSGACDYVGPEFRLSASQTNGLEPLSKGECEQFFVKYYHVAINLKLPYGSFITGTINALRSKGESAVTYSDGETVAYRDAADNTGAIILPPMKCEMLRGDVIFGPDLNGWNILIRLRTDNGPVRRYAELNNTYIVYKTIPTNQTCAHNQLDSNCWCENSDYCMNKYCIFGKCEDSPLCESELGEVRVSQNCTCGDDTCATNQFCMNGQCLDHLFCPNSDGLENITKTCQCGSNECTPGQACQSGECLASPLCPNTNGFQPVLSRCSCGSIECSKDQYCNSGVCLNKPPCVGYGNKTILEPEQCECGSNECSQNQICFEGNCLGPTELTCKTDGIHSYNVSCQCGAQTCGPSQFCYFNKCFDNPVCPFERPFNGLCYNGAHSLYASECKSDGTFGIFGYCSNSKFTTKAQCEQENTWGYCSNSTILTRQECLKRCTLDDYGSQKFNESNCQNERQLNIICNSEPCFVQKVRQYSDSDEYIGCLVGLDLPDITEQNCYTDNTILTCTDKQSGSPIIVSGDSLTSVEYQRLKDMDVSIIDDIVRQNYVNSYNEILLEGHPCLQEHEILPENNWTDACTNPLLKTFDECRRSNDWTPGCSIEGIESPTLCASLLNIRSETCSCNLFSADVEVCGLGQICKDNRCQSSSCAVNNFDMLPMHCNCGSTLCPKDHVCHEDEACRELPLCGFHQENNSPQNNINCLCKIGLECDSNDVLEPCTMNSCNNQTSN